MKLLLVFISFLIASVVTSPILENEAQTESGSCATGPTYWCSNMKHAQECGAVQHCTDTVWKHQNIKPEQSNLLPFDEKKCTYGPSYWCSNIERAKACGAVQHCIDTIWTKQKITVNLAEPMPICTECIKLFTNLKSMLGDNATKAQIESGLSIWCSMFQNSTRENMCRAIITERAEEIMSLLVANLDPTVFCSVIAMCVAPSLEDKVPHTSVFVPGVQGPSNYCNDCLAFFGDVNEIIQSNETRDQFEQLFDQLCQNLPDPLKDVCDDFVNDEMGVALTFLASQVEPNVICRMINFCDGPSFIKLHIANVFEKYSKKRLTNDEECEVCKEILNEVDEELRDTIVQDKVKQLIETDFCSHFETLTYECKELTEEYLPLFFQQVISLLDPTTLCETIDMCKTPTVNVKVIPALAMTPAIKSDPKAVTPLQADSGVCDICKDAMAVLDNLLKDNATIATVDDLLDQICDKLPDADLQDQCRAFVEEYGQLVLTLLANELDPSVICTKLGLCTSQKSIEPVKASPEVCELCCFVISEAEKILKNISTDELIGDLKMACSYFPAEFSEKCNSYVSQYAPLMISLLKNGEDPKALCSLAKVCTSSDVAKHALLDMSKPYMTVPIKEDDVPKDTLDMSKPYMTVPIKEGSDADCEACKTMAAGIRFLVGENATKQKIEYKIDELCYYFKAYKPYCERFLRIPGFIDMLAQGLDTDTICQRLGKCHSDTVAKIPLPEVISPYETLQIKIDEHTQVAVETSPSIECEVCDTIIVMFKSLVSQNSTEAEILAELEKACASLPDVLSGECTSLLNQYGDEIIKWLLEDLDAYTICKELGLCASNSAVQAGPSTECALCTTVINTVKSLISEKSTKAEIKDELEKVCAKLPELLESECTDLLSKYGDAIIEMLLNDLDANTICKEIGLCTGSSAVETSPSIECEVCDTVIVMFKSLVSQNSTEAEILAELEKACDILPAIASECTSLLNQYGDKIIKLLLEDVDAKTICKEIGLCASSSAVKAGPSITCEVCGTVIVEIKALISQNSTKAEIEAVLETACNAIGSLSAECKALVEEYEPLLINLLLQNLDANTICKELGLCTSNSAPPAGTITDVAAYKPAVLSSSTEVDIKVAVADGPSLSCQFCGSIVFVIKELISNNDTEQEFLAEFLEICDSLGGDVSTICKEMVQEYGPQLYELLEQNLDAKTICGPEGLELCDANSTITVGVVADVPAFMSPYDTLPISAGDDKKVPDKASCDACKDLTSWAIEQLKKPQTDTNIQALLDTYCNANIFAYLRVECKRIVDYYTPRVLYYITLNASPEYVCKQILYCPKYPPGPAPPAPSPSPTVVKSAVKSTQETCLVCSGFLDNVFKSLEQDSTVAEIESMLSNVCEQMRAVSRISDACKDIVMDYTPKIISKILTGETPLMICQDIDMCPTPYALPQVAGAVSVVDSDIERRPTKVGCETCVYIMTQVRLQLGSTAGEKTVESVLDTVCDGFIFSKICQNIVKKYTSEIVNLIVVDMSPAIDCELMELCPRTKPPKPTPGPNKLPAPVHFKLLKDNTALAVDQDRKPKVVYCLVCEIVMNAIENNIANNKTQERISSAMSNACMLISNTSLFNDCLEFVRLYSGVIVEDLVNNIEARQICTRRQFCSDVQLMPLRASVQILPEENSDSVDRHRGKHDHNKKPVTKKPRNKNGAECIFCEFAIHELQNLLQGNTSQAAVKEALDKVCSLMPETFSAECKQFVDKYEALLINLLVQQLNAKQICTEIGLCTASRRDIVDLDYCDVCKFVVEEIDDALKKNETIPEIEARLENFCNILPDTVSAQCQELVDQYVPALVAFLKDDLGDPTQACQTIGACTTSVNTGKVDEVKVKTEEEDDTLRFRPHA